MLKKGQITLFAIIAVVVLVIGGLFLYSKGAAVKGIRDANAEKSNTALFSKDPVIAFAQGCINLVSIEAGYDIALHGGYAESPLDWQKTQIEGTEYNISFALKGTQNALPSMDVIRSEMEKYMKLNLPKCTDNFKNFTSKGYSIEQGEITGEVTIDDKGYSVKVNYPITSKLAGAETKFSDFDEVKVPIRLKHMRDVVNEIVSQTISHPQHWINVGYLTGLEKDDIVALYFPKGRQIAFVLRDAQSSVLKGSVIVPNDKDINSNRQFIFVFGMDFSSLPAQPDKDFEMAQNFAKQ